MNEREKKLREALERLTAETDNPISREIGRAALAACEPGQELDLELFYAQLVDGQIIKESDGEPWPLTKPEAKQICDALRQRLAQPATAKESKP